MDDVVVERRRWDDFLNTSASFEPDVSPPKRANRGDEYHRHGYYFLKRIHR